MQIAGVKATIALLIALDDNEKMVLKDLIPLTFSVRSKKRRWKSSSNTLSNIIHILTSCADREQGL